MNEQQFLYQHPPLMKWKAVGQQFDQYAIFFITNTDGTIVHISDSFMKQLLRRYGNVQQFVDRAYEVLAELHTNGAWRGKRSSSVVMRTCTFMRFIRISFGQDAFYTIITIPIY